MQSVTFLKKKLQIILASILIFAHYVNSRVFLVQELYSIFFSWLNLSILLLVLKDFLSSVMQYILSSFFFIPEDLEQLLYQHMLVLHSVRNSTSVLKQLKCRLRNVCCLIKDLCVQYVVPKYVLDICCFQNTYLIPLVQYFTIFYKFLAST